MADTDLFLQLEKHVQRSSPQRPATTPAPPSVPVQQTPSLTTPRPQPDIKSNSPLPSHSPLSSQEKKGGRKGHATEVGDDVTHDATIDVMTSVLGDVNKKLWREMIEETETHNSSLRISLKEREHIEDVVRDLKRKYRIKTSMNEIARLGLLFLMHNFKKYGEKSIIADVKTA